MTSRPKQSRTAPGAAPLSGDAAGRGRDGVCAQLAAALAAGDVAAVLLRLAAADERTLINIAKTLAPVAQAKDVALLLDGHADLVARAGADGAHLTGMADFGERSTSSSPTASPASAGSPRHDAMSAAEQGADYVMFGEPDAEGVRPTFAAIEERVAWWAEVFEAPCVAFAASIEEVAPLVRAGADFIALGDWIWRDSHTVAATIADAASGLLLVPEATA